MAAVLNMYKLKVLSFVWVRSSVLSSIKQFLLQWRAPDGVLRSRLYVTRMPKRRPFSRLSGSRCWLTTSALIPSARWYVDTPPLVQERSIVMSISVCVCLCLCLSVSKLIWGTTRLSPHFCACRPCPELCPLLSVLQCQTRVESDIYDCLVGEWWYHLWEQLTPWRHPGLVVVLLIAVMTSRSLCSSASELLRHVMLLSRLAEDLRSVNSAPRGYTHAQSPVVKVIDSVKVLHLTRHKIGHFRDVLPSQSLGLVLKTKSKITKANIHP